MTAERFRLLEERGGVVDLSGRAKLMLSGVDRVRYLNGQVTNDVRRATAEEAIYACVTNAKGRIEGDVFIHAMPGESACLMLDAEAGLRESLGARLEKYIVADDVEIRDVTEEWRITHVFGAAAEGCGVKARRFGVEGFDLWMAAPCDLKLEIGDWGSDDVKIDANEMEALRIIRGIPRWPNEMNADAFPQEAGLENRAMDFSKGCYIGQEILSRIKTTRKMPRVLVRWLACERSERELSLPLNVFVRGDDGSLQEAGAVTSVVMHPVLDRMTGLAYVRQGLEGADSLLLAAKETPNIAREATIIRS